MLRGSVKRVRVKPRIERIFRDAVSAAKHQTTCQTTNTACTKRFFFSLLDYPATLWKTWQPVDTFLQSQVLEITLHATGHTGGPPVQGIEMRPVLSPPPLHPISSAALWGPIRPVGPSVAAPLHNALVMLRHRSLRSRSQRGGPAPRGTGGFPLDLKLS